MIKHRKLDNTWLFAVVGLIVPAITFGVAYYFLKDKSYVSETANFMKDKELLSKLISLSAVPNLGVFMLVLNQELYKAARGVILSTILITFLMLLVKFVL